MISFDEFRTSHAVQIDELYLRAGAARWKIPEGQWAAALYRTAISIELESGEVKSEHLTTVDLGSLHATDLAFAVAFRLGCSEAMDYFEREQRKQIRSLAAESAQSPSQLTRLTEKLRRELHGHEMKDGRRLSLFEQFDGRVALRDWLRALVEREIAKES